MVGRAQPAGSSRNHDRIEAKQQSAQCRYHRALYQVAIQFHNFSLNGLRERNSLDREAHQYKPEQSTLVQVNRQTFVFHKHLGRV